MSRRLVENGARIFANLVTVCYWLSPVYIDRSVYKTFLAFDSFFAFSIDDGKMKLTI